MIWKTLIIVLSMNLALQANTTASNITNPATESFLRNYRHAYHPYSLPLETSLDEIARTAGYGFNAMGIGFCGPFDGGNINWSSLDNAVNMLSKRNLKVVIHIYPRFVDSEGIADTLSDGRRITHTWNKSPEYAMIDVFNPLQRMKFDQYLADAAERYGNNPSVIGFCFGWGYLGETGFFIGDFMANGNNQGNAAAGYSSCALYEYNKWRKSHGKVTLDSLPMPSISNPSEDYIDWMHFRHFYTANVFEAEAIAAMKAKTNKPIGTFAYLPASPQSYARGWSCPPNADFLRTAGSAASYDNTRTLSDSAIGYEDNVIQDAPWQFNSTQMQCDEARMIAKGTTFHCMFYKGYETEPQWEAGLFGKVSKFLLTQNLYKQIKPEPAIIALFQPTWSTAALPARDAEHLFIPSPQHEDYISRMVGLVESFGLPYKLVTEDDLLDANAMKAYKWIILPLSDLASKFLGAEKAKELLSDPRVIAIKTRTSPVPRSEMRLMLQTKKVPIYFDYDSDKILAGRVNNLIFNWSADNLRVRTLWNGKRNNIDLSGKQYVILR